MTFDGQALRISNLSITYALTTTEKGRGARRKREGHANDDDSRSHSQYKKYYPQIAQI
jgi:hypothetical protein